MRDADVVIPSPVPKECEGAYEESFFRFLPSVEMTEEEVEMTRGVDDGILFVLTIVQTTLVIPRPVPSPSPGLTGGPSLRACLE